MRSILCIIFLHLAGNISGQSYIPVIGQDSSTWYMTECFEGCDTRQYFAQGDTLIDSGISYKKLYGNGNPLLGLLREDTTSRKVYFLPAFNTDQLSDTIEYLLYDFNLESGDSSKLLSHYFQYNTVLAGDGLINGIVDSTNIITTLAGPRKAIYIHGIDNPYYRSITVEGVGEILYTENYFLNCYYKDGVHEFMQVSPLLSYYGDSVCDFDLGIEPSKKESEFVVWPLPVTNRISLKLRNENDQLLKVTISNSIGQILIKREMITTEETIDVSQLLPGYYILKAQTRKNMVINSHFLKI